MKALLGSLLLLSTTAFGKGVYVLVTPSWDESAFQCQIRSDKTPPVVENDTIKFRVTVKGGSGPYLWRLPLYKTNNGANDVSLARVGEVSLDRKNSFVIDLNVQDLEKIDRKNIELRLRSRERYEATCKVAAENFRALASQVPPKAFQVIEGAVTR